MSADLFSLVFNQMQEGVVVRDRKGELIYVNPAACAVWGRTVEEIRRDPELDPLRACYLEQGNQIPPASHPALRVLAGGKPIRDCRLAVKRPDGELRWLSLNATPVLEPGSSQPAYVVVTFQDMTQHLEKDRDLEEKTRVLADISTHLPVMIHGIEIMPDGSRKGIYVSNGSVSLYGRTPQEVLATRGVISSAILPEDRPAVMKEVERSTRTLGPGGATFRIRHTNGQIKWVDARSQSSRLPNGRILLNVIHVDVSEQKELEERLRMFENIVEPSSDLIGCASLDGKPLYLNRTWKARQPPHLRDHPGTIDDVHPAWARELIRSTAIPTALREGVWRGESALIDQSGHEIPVSQVLICHKDGAGKPLFFSTIIRDITDLKDMQARLLTTSRLTALGETSAGIAHEINNPLTVIVGYSAHLKQLLDEVPADTSHLEEYVEKIEATCMRIAQIVKSLRALSREVGDEEFSRVPLKGILDDTLSLCRTRLSNQNIRLEVANIPLDLEIDCRPTEISHTLLNLLNNASDAVAESRDKWIRVDFEDRGDQVELAIVDSGPGIPEAIRGKIMQPFFTTKDVGAGTGLGLSISSAFVKRHRGELFLDTESTHTRFVVVLPKTQKSRRPAIL